MKVLVITKNTRTDSGWGRYSFEVVKRYPGLGFETLVLDEDNHLEPATSLLGIIKNCLKTRKIGKDFEIIHAFDSWPYALYGWFAVLGTGKKFFINAVGTYSVVPLQKLFRRNLFRLIYNRANRVFAISNFVKIKILKYIKLKNISTVYLGYSEFPKLSQQEILEFKQKFQIRTNKYPVILTIGEVKNRKGQYEVVQSVKKLKEKYSEVLYIVVGSSQNSRGYMNKISSLVELEKLTENVMFISNAKTDKELSFFYEICDVFVLNAKNDNNHIEGFGLVMLEAASFGRPVVGSAGTALEESMRNGFNGILINDLMGRDISEAIQKVLDNNEVYGENSRTFCESFSWDKTVKKYTEYYRL